MFSFQGLYWNIASQEGFKEKGKEIFQKYEELTRTLYGIKSEEYFHILSITITSLEDCKMYSEAYKVALKMYDISNELEEPEDGHIKFTSLCYMAVIKSGMGEYEDAKNIIKRIESIRKKYPHKLDLNSIFIATKSRISKLTDKVIEKPKKRQKRSKIFKIKVLGGLALVGVLTFGAIYILKPRK